MIKKVSGRTAQPFPQTKMEIFTDGNNDYTYVLLDYYADTWGFYMDKVNGGDLQMIKQK